MRMAITLAALLCSTTVFAETEARPVAFVIETDFGGFMSEYYTVRDLMYGNKVIIDGNCMSACVMFLRNDFGLDVCMTWRAVFGFHQPYLIDAETHAPIVSSAVAKQTHELWLVEFYNQLPGDLRSMLKGKRIPAASSGDETNLFYTLTAANLIGTVPFCAEGWEDAYILRPKPTGSNKVRAQ